MSRIENNNPLKKENSIYRSAQSPVQDNMISVLSEQDNIVLSEDQKLSILDSSQQETEDIPGLSIEKNNNNDLWKKVAIGVGIAAGVTAALVLAKKGRFKRISDYTLTRGKNLLNKIPYRFKSPLHNEFTYTGDQMIIRNCLEYRKRGLSLEEIARKLYGEEEVAKTGIEPLKKYTQELLERVDNKVLKLDNSFKNIIPSPIRHTYYRGISGQNYGTQVINEAKAGDIITPDLGYCFASMKKSVADSYSNISCMRRSDAPFEQCIMKIITPSGSRISRNFSHLSEVVFPRGAQYKVLKKQIVDGKTLITLKYLT